MRYPISLRGDASEGTRGALRPFVIGGLAVVAGAVAYIAHLVARSLLTAGADPVTSAEAPLWVPVNILGAVSSGLVLVGLPAIYRRLDGGGGWAGLVGFALISLSWTFFGPFLSLYGALVQPWLADEAPRLLTGSSTPAGFVAAFAAGLLAWLAGAVLLSVPLLKGPARSRWLACLLPISALWSLVGSVIIAPDGPASDVAVNLLSNLGPVLLLLALGSLGLRAWTEPSSAACRPTSRHGSSRARSDLAAGGAP